MSQRFHDRYRAGLSRPMYLFATVAVFALAAACKSASGSDGATSAASNFHKTIEPILMEYCSDCHADGMNKGKVAFDELGSDEALTGNDELWLKVLKNLRAGLMPPQKKSRPKPEEQLRIENWIKYEAFGIDPKNPDPGRVTVRRLNRVEYANTIKDLMGIDFDTQVEFPPDDTGYGFDNIGDVLTVSPVLLEKYIRAAETIVAKSVPKVGKTIHESVIQGKSFRSASTEPGREEKEKPQRGDGLSLSYYETARVTNSITIEHDGVYELELNVTANEKFVDNQYDYNKCRMIFRVDGEKAFEEEYSRQGRKPFRYTVNRDWKSGPHEFALELQPLTPEEKQVRSLTLRLDSVTVRGPKDEKYWIASKNYSRFFPHPPPEASEEKRAYASEVLEKFAVRAFRRPVDKSTTERLVGLAQQVYERPGQTFEAGISHAMVAVLASPRFLFREEKLAQNPPPRGFALIDEYSLASRLSYFLWSSMPDDELFRLAGANELRKNLDAQVQRMLKNSRAQAFIRNFTGQWLQARDIETVVIDSRSVLQREEKVDPDRDQKRSRMRQLRGRAENTLSPEEKEELEKLRSEFVKRSQQPVRAELTGELRRAMRQETEKYFEFIVREDRSVLELVNSDYAFLNERLAKHYGLPEVTGDEIRLVKLPSDSVRGGILTQGTVLAVTSNPTRTSPVKRGLFILDNVLGTPPPPPPPDIPPLEDAAKAVTGREPSLRETLELHRSQPLCHSCHNRMDPLGLALENFNAMGMWREKERDQPIDSTGTLITGEPFQTTRQLKQILVTNHSDAFYRCLTEKLMTYAIGRGLDYRDTETVDQIVAKLDASNGRFSVLLAGIINSAPFQKAREAGMLADASPANR